MTYEFDFHLAKQLVHTKKEKELFTDKDFRFYRKRIYGLTKWMIQNRHKKQFKEYIPDGTNHPLSNEVIHSFDRWIATVIHLLKWDDTMEQFTNDCSFSYPSTHHTTETRMDTSTTGTTGTSTSTDMDIEDISFTLPTYELNQYMMSQSTPSNQASTMDRYVVNESTTKQEYPRFKTIQLDNPKYRTKGIPITDKKKRKDESQ